MIHELHLTFYNNIFLIKYLIIFIISGGVQFGAGRAHETALPVLRQGRLGLYRQGRAWRRHA